MNSVSGHPKVLSSKKAAEEEKNNKKVYNEVSRSKPKQVKSRQRVDTLIVKESLEWTI